LGLTIVAFVVTALPSWALTKVIGKNLESLWVISIALLVGGIVMWIVDATFTRVRVTHMEEMNCSKRFGLRLPNSFGGFSRNIALNEYDCGGTNRGLIASGCT